MWIDRAGSIIHTLTSYGVRKHPRDVGDFLPVVLLCSERRHHALALAEDHRFADVDAVVLEKVEVGLARSSAKTYEDMRLAVYGLCGASGT